jgi:hypothetical protein
MIPCSQFHSVLISDPNTQACLHCSITEFHWHFKLCFIKSSLRVTPGSHRDWMMLQYLQYSTHYNTILNLTINNVRDDHERHEYNKIHSPKVVRMRFMTYCLNAALMIKSMRLMRGLFTNLGINHIKNAACNIKEPFRLFNAIIR